MKPTGKTTKAPVFDAEGYQLGLRDLNGEPLPDLRRVVAQPLKHGGSRPGAGRKPTGRKAVLLRLTPATIRVLHAAAKREGKTMSAIAEEKLAQG